MADWALGDGQRYKTYTNPAGAAPASAAAGISLVCGVAPTKGSWYEAVTSLEFGASGVYFNVNNPPLRAAVDVGIGAAGSEGVVIPDITMDAVTAATCSRQFFVPVPFAAGSRVAVRGMADAARTPTVSLMFVGSGFDTGSHGLVRAYGVLTTSLGTNIDPGATINAKGAISSLLPVTTEPIQQIIVCVGTSARTQNPAAIWLVDITVGGETAIPDIPVRTTTATDQTGQAYYGPYALQLPSGVTLGARAMCSINSTNPGRTLSISLLGIT